MAYDVSRLARSGLNLGGYGVPHVAPVQDRENVGNFESITPWTELSNDTTGLAVDAAHVLGSYSLEFDKVNGLDGETHGGVEATIAPLDLSRFGLQDKIVGAFYVSAITDIVHAFVRLGTDSSNYCYWTELDTVPIVAGVWHIFSKTLAEMNIAVVGTGWNPAVTTYVAVGIEFDLEDDALADIRWDSLAIERAIRTRT